MPGALSQGPELITAPSCKLLKTRGLFSSSVVWYTLTAWWVEWLPQLWSRSCHDCVELEPIFRCKGDMYSEKHSVQAL